MDNTELYNRQSMVPLNKINSAIVVGVGGTGSWMAMLLAMSGCSQITLMDSDRFDLSNFVRVPLFPEKHKGLPKTEAVRDLILQLRPDCTVDIEGRASPYTLDMVDGQYIFDCTDNQDVQTMIAKYAKEHDRVYTRVGYNGGTHITVTEKNSSWRTSAATSGYEVVPSWVGCAGLPAFLGLIKVMLCPDLDVSLDIKDLPKLLGAIKR